MNSNLDKWVLAAGILALVALLCAQLYLALSAKADVASSLKEANSLEQQVKKNVWQKPSSDSAAHSGRVFSAWETMPIAKPLSPWDLDPNPMGSRRAP